MQSYLLNHWNLRKKHISKNIAGHWCPLPENVRLWMWQWCHSNKVQLWLGIFEHALCTYICFGISMRMLYYICVCMCVPCMIVSRYLNIPCLWPSTCLWLSVVCVHVHVCVYVHTYVQMCMDCMNYVSNGVWTYIFVCVYLCMYVCTSIHTQSMSTYMPIHLMAAAKEVFYTKKKQKKQTFCLWLETLHKKKSIKMPSLSLRVY